MERNHLVWLGAFIALCALELTGEGLNNPVLILCTKPLLMPVLAVWFARRTPGIQRFLRQTLFAGLVLATVGDILMMFTGGTYGTFFFLLGLGAFLFTHLCYLGGFLRAVNLKNGYLRNQPYWVLPFILFLSVFLYVLWPGIDAGMRLPVAAYATVISAMALGVVNMRSKVQNDAFASLLTGALLFMLSDSLIAVHKFAYPFPAARIVIMATYMLGQWLLMLGASKYLRSAPI